MCIFYKPIIVHRITSIPTQRIKRWFTGTYLFLECAELGTRSFFPGSLSAHFLTMDRYRSTAHFADFQVRSSLNRSTKKQWFALGKER